MVAAWLAFYVCALQSREARRLLEVYARRLQSNLLFNLRQLFDDASAEQIAQGLASLIDGFYIHHALQDSVPDRNDTRALVQDYLELWLEKNTILADKPNILVFMADQVNGALFPDGSTDWLHAPHLKALAARSVCFANAYTGSPLCASGRASYMSGQLPHRTRVYDNAAEFAFDIPTYAHHLRRVGYHTTLSGKMHFVGPDQMHGFEERLTTDVYPADFGWTPD